LDPNASPRKQGTLVVLGIYALHLHEGTNRGAVLNLTIGLHYARGHSRTYIDAGTQILAKYQGIVWKGDPMIPELNPVPNAESQNGLISAVSPETMVSGTCPSNL
jgi:hypothetical protein